MALIMLKRDGVNPNKRGLAHYNKPTVAALKLMGAAIIGGAAVADAWYETGTKVRNTIDVIAGAASRVALSGIDSVLGVAGIQPPQNLGPYSGPMFTIPAEQPPVTEAAPVPATASLE